MERPGERPRNAWAGFVAGVVAGGSGVLVGHAFDTAKVQQQVGGQAGQMSMKNLYRGILPPLCTTGAVRSLYFGLFEQTKRRLEAAGGPPGSTAPGVYCCGCLTGALTAPVTAPIMNLKIRQQIHGDSLWSNVRGLLRSSGVSGFYRGLPAHALLETFGSGSYLLAYHAAKSAAAKLRSSDEEDWMLIRVACGAVSGCCGWISMYADPHVPRFQSLHECSTFVLACK